MRKVILYIALVILIIVISGCVQKIIPEEGKEIKKYEFFGAVKCTQDRGKITIADKISCTTDDDCTVDKITKFCEPDAIPCKDDMGFDIYCNPDGNPLDMEISLPTCGPELYCEDNICKIRCPTG